MYTKNFDNIFLTGFDKIKMKSKNIIHYTLSFNLIIESLFHN